MCYPEGQRGCVIICLFKNFEWRDGYYIIRIGSPLVFFSVEHYRLFLPMILLLLSFISSIKFARSFSFFLFFLSIVPAACLSVGGSFFLNLSRSFWRFCSFVLRILYHRVSFLTNQNYFLIRKTCVTPERILVIKPSL